MRYLLLLLMFWTSSPAYSNDFVVCGWQIDDDDPRREVFDLNGAEPAPFAVHFSYYSAGQNGSGRLNHCGGAIIEDGWVLTARHCVDQKQWTYLGVNVPELGQSRTADLAICPSEKLAFPKNDVALLRLTEPLPKHAPKAVIGDAISRYPMQGFIPRWPIRRGRPQPDMRLSPITIESETPTPMLSGAMNETSERVPCGGESGSMLINGQGALAGVLTAISSPSGGRPNCNDPETRIFVTPLAEWAVWVAQTVAACKDAPTSCVIPE